MTFYQKTKMFLVVYLIVFILAMFIALEINKARAEKAKQSEVTAEVLK